MKLLSYICLFMLMLSYPEDSFAETSIMFTEVEPLTFPTLAIPISGDANLTVSPLSSATSGNGQVITGMARRGSYRLSSSGEGGLSISVDISNIDTGNSDIILDDFRGFYGGQLIDTFPSSTLSLPASDPQNTPLYIGATVHAGPYISSGSYQGSYTITIFIQ